MNVLRSASILLLCLPGAAYAQDLDASLALDGSAQVLLDADVAELDAELPDADLPDAQTGGGEDEGFAGLDGGLSEDEIPVEVIGWKHEGCALSDGPDGLGFLALASFLAVVRRRRRVLGPR